MSLAGHKKAGHMPGTILERTQVARGIECDDAEGLFELIVRCLDCDEVKDGNEAGMKRPPKQRRGVEAFALQSHVADGALTSSEGSTVCLRRRELGRRRGRRSTANRLLLTIRETQRTS